MPDVNTRDYHLQEIADFLTQLQPMKAYLTIPTRPPAEPWVRPPRESEINRAFQLLQDRINQVEYLIGDEGTTFTSTGDIEGDLLSIIAVHPMREEAVDAMLAKANADWSIVHKLIRRDQIIETSYEGKKFLMRKLPVGD